MKYGPSVEYICVFAQDAYLANRPYAPFLQDKHNAIAFALYNKLLVLRWSLGVLVSQAPGDLPVIRSDGQLEPKLMCPLKHHTPAAISSTASPNATSITISGTPPESTSDIVGEC